MFSSFWPQIWGATFSFRSCFFLMVAVIWESNRHTNTQLCMHMQKDTHTHTHICQCFTKMWWPSICLQHTSTSWNCWKVRWMRAELSDRSKVKNTRNTNKSNSWPFKIVQYNVQPMCYKNTMMECFLHPSIKSCMWLCHWTATAFSRPWLHTCLQRQWWGVYSPGWTSYMWRTLRRQTQENRRHTSGTDTDVWPAHTSRWSGLTRVSKKRSHTVSWLVVKNRNVFIWAAGGQETSRRVHLNLHTTGSTKSHSTDHMSRGVTMSSA